MPDRELYDKRLRSTAGRRQRWAHLGSNQGPLACEASALPLSYAPSDVIVSQEGRGPVADVDGTKAQQATTQSEPNPLKQSCRTEAGFEGESIHDSGVAG